MKKLSIIITILILATLFVSCKPKADTPTLELAETEIIEETPAVIPSITFENVVLEVQEGTVEVTGALIEYDELWNSDVIIFTYNYTNNTDEPRMSASAWFHNFEAVQDNDPNVINSLEEGSIPSEYYDIATKETKVGGTVSAGGSFILSDMTTPVTLFSKDDKKELLTLNIATP